MRLCSNTDDGGTRGMPGKANDYAAIRKSNSLICNTSRPANPDRMDGDKYARTICKILHNLDPMKYAYFAGLDTSHGQTSTLRPTLLTLQKPQPFIKQLKIPESAANASVNQMLIAVDSESDQFALTDSEINIGEFFQDTTVDFVKRSIRSSSEADVKSNCEEMIKLINVISSDTQISDSNPNKTVELNKHQTTKLETRCIELFHNWVGRSKLGLGYLFYLTKQQNGWGDEFITKIVHHLAPRIDELPIEELVTLMLMIYFRRGLWSADEIYEVLDPTLLQKRLVNLINSTKGVSDAELCAICLGLKKTAGFIANIDEFRDALYLRLENIGNILSSEKAFSLDSGHISALNMAVIQITVLLQQGYHMGTRDPAKHILRMLKCYEDAVIAYDETGTENGEGNLRGRFLMETRAATKIMIFGSSKGGLHNKEVTAKVIERLMLGKHIRHLSLRDMVSFLKFLGQVKEFGTSGTAMAGHTTTDIAKVLLNEIKAVAQESEDQLYRLEDIMFILQSWLYLSAFDQFDLDNLRKVMTSINEMPKEYFENCDITELEEQNISLGQHIAEACYRALFPISYSAYLSQEHSSREKIQPNDYANFTRLISALDRTMSIYIENNLFKEMKLDELRIKRLVSLNLSKFPVVLYEKTQLPATITVSRRQKLLHAVHKGLLEALESERYLKIVHILPHFQEPDIVFGHIAGNMISIPSSFSEVPIYDVKPAPEFGEWTVISIDAPSTTARDLGTLAKTTEFAPKHANPERHRQLIRLGYQIYPLTPKDQKDLIRGGDVKWAQKLLANILTGVTQGDPNPRGVPVY